MVWGTLLSQTAEVLFLQAGDEAVHGVGDGGGDLDEVDIDAQAGVAVRCALGGHTGLRRRRWASGFRSWNPAASAAARARASGRCLAGSPGRGLGGAGPGRRQPGPARKLRAPAAIRPTLPVLPTVNRMIGLMTLARLISSRSPSRLVRLRIAGRGCSGSGGTGEEDQGGGGDGFPVQSMAEHFCQERRDPAWPASIRSAHFATTPAASGWRTWSPSPTTRSPPRCSSGTTRRARTTWCASFWASTSRTTPRPRSFCPQAKRRTTCIRGRRSGCASGAGRGSWPRRRSPRSTATRRPTPCRIHRRCASGAGSLRWGISTSTRTRWSTGTSRPFPSTRATGWRCSRRRGPTASRCICCTPTRRSRRRS